MVTEIIVYIISFFGLYFLIFCLMTLFENRKQLYREIEKENFPPVAIIIPCFNEKKTIGKTIESLLNLDYPKNKLEILVVDDGSTDQTFAVAQTYTKYPSVRVFRKANGGKHTALNFGLKRANATLVGCLDADSFVDPLALKKMLPYFGNLNTQAVTASLKVYRPQSILQRIQSIEYLFGIFLRKCFSLMGGLYVAPGPFTLFRRNIYDEIGYYCRAYNTEDMEIALRLQKNHYQIENVLDAYVYTTTPAKFKSLYRQRIRWYQGLLRNGWDYRQMFFNFNQGTLGLFLLPTICFHILAFLFLVTLFLFQTGTRLINSFQVWQAIGFEINVPDWRLEWFFVNTQALIFISLISFSIFLLIIYLGKKLSRDHLSFFNPFFLKIFFYSFLYFVWWIGALIQVIFRQKSNWLKEKNSRENNE